MNAESEMSKSDGLGGERRRFDVEEQVAELEARERLDPVKQIAESTGYDPNQDIKIETLIAHKDALEDAVRQLSMDREEVNVVMVDEHVFVFARDHDSHRFYKAVEAQGESPWGMNETILSGDAAEREIRESRSKALEQHMPTLAEDVLKGLSLINALRRVKTIRGHAGFGEVETLLTEWIALDGNE